MPELPEVETSRRGILPLVQRQQVARVIIRQAQLRWPIPDHLPQTLALQHICDVQRRGKYLLLRCDQGTLIIHLGMSGCLRVVPANTPVAKHDHVDVVLTNQQCLRLTDPRRFGCMLWTDQDPLQHTLLAKLGPEPLQADFHPDYFVAKAAHHKTAIKQFVMNSHIVVGVGNIYANEALFRAGIHPQRPANKISRQRLTRLCEEIKKVLTVAIEHGGTTLKDFYSATGKPGYFRQALVVYGRTGQACVVCAHTLKEIRLGQRATIYCPRCQR